MIDPESIPKLMAAGTIEVAPLAYMRGRTLNDAFIILDEAQNTTPEQMKMFLTRLGFGSKIVVTGDVTQIDLPGSTRSGLQVVRDILDGIDDVHFSYLTSTDVVRHRLVSDIVDAYARFDAASGRHTLTAAPRTGPPPRTAPAPPPSELQVVRDILDGIDDVHFSLLTSTDVVRHRLVSDIVDAYARFDPAAAGTRSRRAAHRPAAGPHPRPPPRERASPARPRGTRRLDP